MFPHNVLNIKCQKISRAVRYSKVRKRSKISTIGICRFKLQYSPELRKIRPQAEHKFNHLFVVKSVWPLQMDRKQVSNFVTMGHSCIKETK
jgi:hypothetical protein